jgi:hypothetical protein
MRSDIFIFLWWGAWRSRGGNGWVQVGTEETYRGKAPGVALTIAESNHWQGAMAKFYTPQGSEDTDKVDKPTKGKPRAATLSWIRMLRNGMLHGTSWTLDDYVVDWVGLEAVISSGVELTIDHLRKYAPTLAVNLDQGPTQVAASCFLTGHLHINWVPLWDPTSHRSNNDVNGAVKDAKLSGIPLASAPLYNYEAGPWASAAWSKEMDNTVEEMVATLGPDDSMVLQVWPDVCRQQGWISPADTSRDARQSFLDTFQERHKRRRARSEMVANARWHSFQHRAKQMMPVWAEHTLKWAFHALYTGVVARSWQLFQTHGSKVKIAVDPPPPAAPGAASSSGDPMPLPASTTTECCRPKGFKTFENAQKIQLRCACICLWTRICTTRLV